MIGLIVKLAAVLTNITSLRELLFANSATVDLEWLEGNRVNKSIVANCASIPHDPVEIERNLLSSTFHMIGKFSTSEVEILILSEWYIISQIKLYLKHMSCEFTNK